MEQTKHTPEDTQNTIYARLISEDIPQISSRFIAMRLMELNNKSVVEVIKETDFKILVTTEKKKYSISLHLLDLPDAKFVEL